MQESYKNYVGAIITRLNTVTETHYRDDPTILGWEIANEPSNPGDDTGDVLQVGLLPCAILFCGGGLPAVSPARRCGLLVESEL